MTMNRMITLLTILLILLLMPTVVAESGNFAVNTWVVGSGGGESHGNTFTVAGVAGQPQVGDPAQSAGYTVVGGFWSMSSNPAGTGGNRSLYLPLIARQNPPTVVPPPPKQWRRFANPGLNVSALAIQNNDQLFVGDRNNGGLYKGALATCQAGGTLTRLLNLKIFDLAFQGNQGALADFNTTIHYSSDNGNTWTPTSSTVKNPLAVEIAGGNTFYAGTTANGIYISRNGGVTWDSLNSQPQNINVLTLNTNTLWVGTDGAGVFIFVAASSQPEESNNGLGGEGKKVWDFAFDTTNNVYIATFDGVYKSNISATQWQPFGLQGLQLYSLEIYGDHLYVGVRDPGNQGRQAGVRRRLLNGGNWEEISSPGWDTTYTVRDLFYEATHCQGLLAATDDGVWVYR